MLSKYFFVTGTDTNVGKTMMTASLLVALKRKRFSAVGIKPVASGCTMTAEGLRCSDALLLMEHNSITLPYHVVNPIAFETPVAPHFLSNDLSSHTVVKSLQAIFTLQSDYCLLEGVGGWRVPLNATETMADVARALPISVIMVVGLRLGCLNHALLTQEAILNDGISIAGWIANCIDPAMLYVDQNIKTLEQRITAPLLGVVPYQSDINIETIADCLEVLFCHPRVR